MVWSAGPCLPGPWRLRVFDTVHAFSYQASAVMLSAIRPLLLWCYLKGYALCRRPLSSWQLPFGGLGAFILAPRGTILAPREHPGGPFWHVGTTLEDHGNSRMDTRWSFTESCSIWTDFWTLFWKFFGHRGLKFQFVFGFVSRSLLIPLSDSKFQFLGLINLGSRQDSIAKNTFSHKSIFRIFRIDFDRFLETLEPVFLVFCALDTSMIFLIFDRTRI